MLRSFPIFAVIAVILLLVLSSCSSSGIADPTVAADPGVSPGERTSSSGPHQCWGLYTFTIDPSAKTLEYEPNREGSMHLNVLQFLEPPPLVNLTLESVVFAGDKVIADIGLRHPFLGLDEFTGFDVCGVVITDGNRFGFQDSEIRMPRTDETRLVNADGYTRWWNPLEFPYNGTMFSYKNGKLGLGDEFVEYATTINGYKYFTESLGPNDPVTDADLNKRGMFAAGQKNIRKFEIQWDSYGLIFNYAIDASWEFPEGSHPWEVPGDFGPDANKPEAWHIEVTETDNTLFNDGAYSGGDLSLSIDVYDWYNPDLNVLRVESPGCFTAKIINTPSGGGTGYSTYTVDITAVTPPEDWLDILITAECEVIGYQGKLPGRKVSAYQRYFAEVSPEYSN